MTSRDFVCANNCANDERCSVCGPCGERADEKAFHRGYDQGRLDQKTEEPPLKAREYRAQLMSERAAWAAKQVSHAALRVAVREWMASRASTSDAVYLAACRRLQAALGDEP